MNTRFLKNAEKQCQDRNEKLTKPRFEVLKILSAAKEPIGAYDILELLGKEIPNPKPPTVYRALEFWQKLGLVHKIGSLNHYVVCKEDHVHEGSQHLICQNCNMVKEIHSDELLKSLAELSKKLNFTDNFWNIEVTGTCKNCRQ